MADNTRTARKLNLTAATKADEGRPKSTRNKPEIQNRLTLIRHPNKCIPQSKYGKKLDNVTVQIQIIFAEFTGFSIA